LSKQVVKAFMPSSSFQSTLHTFMAFFKLKMMLYDQDTLVSMP